MLNYLNKDERYKKYDIGRYSYGSPKIEEWDYNCGKLHIGSFCSIARGVTIWLGGNHHKNWITTSVLSTIIKGKENDKTAQVSTKGDVWIGSDVWIGAEASIMSGVTIGDGSVIGAYSVVAKDIPSYGIAVGNPITLKGYRFSPKQIEELMRIKWWYWDIAKIEEDIELLLSPDIDAFIQKHKKS